jgi:hypothetical protein
VSATADYGGLLCARRTDDRWCCAYATKIWKKFAKGKLAVIAQVGDYCIGSLTGASYGGAAPDEKWPMLHVVLARQVDRGT